jgi:SGNH domain (fused to AT3 domains)
VCFAPGFSYPECVSGNADAPTTLALVGDSHAVNWHPAAEPIAMERHWRLEPMSRALCPLMHLPIPTPNLRRESTKCGQWRVEVAARLKKERPGTIELDIARRYAAVSAQNDDGRVLTRHVGRADDAGA